MRKRICAGGPRHLAEQTEEVVRRRSRDLLKSDAARLGQHLRGFDHIGRLVAFAAKRSRRKIRRVGLDQDTVGRQRGRDRTQLGRILKRQDAGERDKEPERNGALGEFAAAGEAMQHGREGALPVSSSRILAVSASALRE